MIIAGSSNDYAVTHDIYSSDESTKPTPSPEPQYVAEQVQLKSLWDRVAQSECLDVKGPSRVPEAFPIEGVRLIHGKDRPHFGPQDLQTRDERCWAATY
jgi:hypothetical protein